MNFSIVPYPTRRRLLRLPELVGDGMSEDIALQHVGAQLAVVSYADDAGVGREAGEPRQELYVPQGAVGVAVVGGAGRFDSYVAGIAVRLGRLDYHVGVIETSERVFNKFGSLSKSGFQAHPPFLSNQGYAPTLTLPRRERELIKHPLRRSSPRSWARTAARHSGFSARARRKSSWLFMVVMDVHPSVVGDAFPL